MLIPSDYNCCAARVGRCPERSEAAERGEEGSGSEGAQTAGLACRARLFAGASTWPDAVKSTTKADK